MTKKHVFIQQMAIYRMGGYATSIVREIPEEPTINTPEKGEAMLLQALANIEDYSKQLVIAHQEMLQKIGSKLEAAGKIACDALDQHKKITGEFANASALEIMNFEKLVSNVEAVADELSCVGDLYDDVCRLSDLLTSVEQYAAQKKADTPQILY